MTKDIAFEMAVSSVRFGVGVTREVGMDLAEMGARLVMVVTDPVLPRCRRCAPCSSRWSRTRFRTRSTIACASSRATSRSSTRSRSRNERPFDAFVAVGGGSTIDTAKAVNLYTTYPPADFLDYVNPPIGKGLPVPGPLKPLIAIPTTAGTGSETTGVTIFDYKKLKAKTGIANRRLKPTLGYLDPDNTRTMPPQVAASTGLDILSHAIESFTAMPFTDRPMPDRPAMRPAYQGSNPISDIWSMQALRMVNQFLVRAFDDTSDDEARANMLLAASYAGVGFGNAGVHLPHGMSYPVSGNVKSYRAPGYVTDHAIVPHGMSVILNAPAVFRFTARANPARHLQAAEALGAERLRREGGGRRQDPRGSHHLVHAAAADAERPEGDRLFLVRHSRAGRRHAAAAPRDEALAASGRPDELSALFEDAMVAW